MGEMQDPRMCETAHPGILGAVSGNRVPPAGAFGGYPRTWLDCMNDARKFADRRLWEGWELSEVNL
jgi:hypothetical protein